MARICFLTLLGFLLILNLFVPSQTKKSKQRLTKLSENKACRADSFLQTVLFLSYSNLTKTNVKTSLSFSTSHDVNGNKVCLVKPTNGRAFSIQTLANLPTTHRSGVNEKTAAEVANYVKTFGTKRQRYLIAASL